MSGEGTEYTSFDDLIDADVAEEQAQDLDTEETTEEQEEAVEEPEEEQVEEEGEESEEADEEATEELEKSTEEEPAEEKEEPAPEPATYTVKVDGVEKQVTSDELVRNYQLASASHERFRKANELDQQARTALKNFTQNPFDTLLNIYAGQFGNYQQAEDQVQQHIEQYMRPFLEEASGGEAAIQHGRLQRQNQYLSRQNQEALQQQQQIQAQEQARQFVARIRSEIPGVLESAGLPHTEEVERQVLEQFRKADEGAYDLTVQEAVLEVKRLRDSVSESFIPALTIEELIEKRPDLREHIMKEAQASLTSKAPRKSPTSSGSAAKKPTPTRSRRSKGKEEVSIHEIFN